MNDIGESIIIASTMVTSSSNSLDSYLSDARPVLVDL
jgi:hypothetical protein